MMNTVNIVLAGGAALTAFFTLFVAVFTLFVAIFTALAAIASQRSAEETRKTTLAQLVIDLKDDYASSDMREGVLELIKFKKEHGNEFAQKFAKRRSDKMDEYRRSYAHYFHKIAALLDTEVIDEAFVREVIQPDQVHILLNIVEPLEKKINSDYDRSTFDKFRRLFKGRIGRDE